MPTTAIPVIDDDSTMCEQFEEQYEFYECSDVTEDTAFVCERLTEIIAVMCTNGKI